MSLEKIIEELLKDMERIAEMTNSSDKDRVLYLTGYQECLFYVINKLELVTKQTRRKVND